MELLVEDENCVCFLFTHSVHQDFKFCIGMVNIRFISDSALLNDFSEEAKTTNRLRKVEPTIKREAHQSVIQPLSGLNLKCEDPH